MPKIDKNGCSRYEPETTAGKPNLNKGTKTATYFASCIVFSTHEESLHNDKEPALQKQEAARIRRLKRAQVAEYNAAPASMSDQCGLSVSFGKIEIREYGMQLGDNPSVSGGPPIGIGWDYDNKILDVSVDSYESSHPPRRSIGEMKLPVNIREDIVRWSGCDREEVRNILRMVNRTKRRRRSTVNQKMMLCKAEERLESLKRKVRKLPFLSKSAGKVQNLEKTEHVPSLTSLHVKKADKENIENPFFEPKITGEVEKIAPPYRSLTESKSQSDGIIFPSDSKIDIPLNDVVASMVIHGR